MDINDLNSRYEKKHLANIARTNERIREVFSDAIHTLTLSAGRIRFNGEVFDLSKYPALKAQIEEVIKEMGGTIYTALVNSIEASWGLANDKNDILVDRRLAGKKPNAAGRSVLYDPNKGALEAFIKRKDKGLNLSDRVWKGLEPFKTELEKGLGLGIAEGKPAKAMATELKQFLNEPDKLFRRVRDAKGKLRLSKAAKEYHPGQGVYRSSFKNAVRLSVTETNASYRLADNARWANQPFVTGIKIVLSNAHKVYDICDTLNKSIYPKDFVWTGWHPFCKCHQVPVFASDEDYEKIEDAILEGKEPPQIKQTEDTPQVFKDYVEKNRQRIENWKQPPHWWRDNQDYVNGKAKVVQMPKTEEAKQPAFVPAKTIDEAKQRIKDAIVNGHGLNIGNVVTANTLDLDRVNARLQQIERLTSEYEISEMVNKKMSMSIRFRSDSQNLGIVNVVSGTNGKVFEAVNFGSKSDDFVYRQYKPDFRRQREKSRVDDANVEIATLTHEYAHFMTMIRQINAEDVAPRIKTFWKEITELKEEYTKEIYGLFASEDNAALNDLSLGKYAMTNPDEFFAEAFTEYKLSSKPSKYAKSVGAVVDKHFKRK